MRMAGGSCEAKHCETEAGGEGARKEPGSDCDDAKECPLRTVAPDCHCGERGSVAHSPARVHGGSSRTLGGADSISISVNGERQILTQLGSILG
jgi:hypothetical protein